jgi:Glycosyltransferase family 87
VARSGLLSSGPPILETPATKSQRAILAAACILLLLALAKFISQDVRKFEHPANDLLSPWVTSNLFIDGKNPYTDTPDFARIVDSTHFLPQEAPPDYQRVLAYYGRIYPPTTLLLIAPLAMMPWRAAVCVYLIGAVALLVAMVIVMASNLPFRWSDPRKLYFVAFALALTPLHFGIVTVNLNTLGIALLCAGVGFMRPRPYVSGAAIGIALCLKPQLALLLFLYLWLRKKWRVAFTALGFSVFISAISLLWLKFHNIEWFSAWRNEVHQCGIPPGGCAAFTTGLQSLQFLNLQALIYQFTLNPALSTMLSLALFTVLAGISLYLIVTRISNKNESAGLAIISVLTLLPIYQNFYTGAILLFVLYWAVENWSDKRGKVAQLFMLPLLIPVFSTLVARFVANHNLASNTIWNGFVMLHVIWIELLLLILLLVSLYRKPQVRTVSYA